MVQTRQDDAWMRRGVTLLWSLEDLQKFVAPDQVLSMRAFFAIRNHWPEDLPAYGGDALVVAGLEGCLDVLSADDAAQWIETDLKDAILSFQDEYQGQAGLVFWVPSGKARIRMKSASEEYIWKHKSSGSDHDLPIGRLMLSGAEREFERLLSTGDEHADFDGPAYIGLHHPRIS